MNFLSGRQPRRHHPQPGEGSSGFGFHEDYDDAVAAFAQRMARGTGAANQAGMRMKRSDDDSHIGENAVFKRPG